MRLKNFKIPTWIWLSVLILTLLYITLTPVTLWGINWALTHQLENYTGSASALELNLQSGKYQLNGLEIKHKNLMDSFLKIDSIQVSLILADLIQGKITGDVLLQNAHLRITAAEKKEKPQQKQGRTEEKKWQDTFEHFIPIQIKNLKITNSDILFSVSDIKKTHNLHLEKINLTATNLHNRTELFQDSLSPIKASALLQGHAAVTIQGKVDVKAKHLRFDIDLSVVNFKPKEVNELLMKYVPLDLTKGELSLYTEVAASSDQMIGYVKIFLKDVDVIASNQYIKSAKHASMEIGSAFANWILKNSKDQVTAAQIPFKRQGGKFEVDGGEAFWSAIKNKSKELKKGFDNSIDLKNLERQKKSISQH